MKFLYKFPTLLFALTLFIGIQAGMAQTVIFTESIGTCCGTNNTAIGSTTFDNSDLTFTGDADTRTSTASTGYTGASGGRNVFITNTIGRFFQISGVDTRGFSDITLSFGHFKNTTAGNNELVVEISENGTDWTQLTYSRATGSGTANWILITPTGTIPEVENLRIRFRQTSTGPQFRIDDITLSGTSANPALSTNPTSIDDLNYIVGSGPSSPSSFSVSGESLDGSNVVLTAPANFEISTSESSGYSGTVTLTAFDGDATTIYARLSAGLAVDDYSGNIAITGGGADPINVALSGEVTELIFLIYSFDSSTAVPTQSPSNTVTSNLSVSAGSITYGSSNSASWTGSGVPYAQSNGGWTATSSDDAKYFSFTLSPNTSYGISLSNISFEYRATNAGPSALTVEINGIEIPNTVKGDANLPNNSTLIFNQPLTGFANLPSVEVKIKGWLNGSRSSNGTGEFHIDDIRLDGEIVEDIYFASLSHQSEGFRLLSTPVPTTFATLLDPIWTQGATGADVSNGSSNVWLWDNTSTTDGNENWQPVGDLGDDIATANGFLVYVFENDIFGDNNSNTWPKVLTVTGVEHGLPAQPSLNDNQNALTLLGNPTSSRLSWSEIFDASSGLQNAVYVYDPASGWLSNVAGEDLGDLTDGVIAPFQGFFVQALDVVEPDPSVSITSDALVGSGGAFYGKQTQQEPLALRLQLDGNGFSNGTWFSFNESASEGRDRRDALQLAPLSQSFAYMASRIEDGTLLSINNLPLEIDDQITFPLTVQASRGGEFTISVDRLNLPEGVSVTITDRENGTRFELTSEASYTFTIGGGTAPKTSGGFTTPGDILATAADDRFEITFSSNPVSVEPRADLPQVLALEQNYPNPFNPTTGIRFELPSSQFVNLAVYDLLGRRVAMLVNEDMSAGSHFVNFDAAALSSGVYVYRLEAGGQVLTRKMTLLK